MPRCALIAVILFALSLGSQGLARAESTASSTISQLMVLSAADDKYKNFHGAVWLDYDKAKVNYRWGGKQCGQTTLTDLQVSLLFAAFKSSYTLTLEFSRRSAGKTKVRCVTGFTVTKDA